MRACGVRACVRVCVCECVSVSGGGGGGVANQFSPKFTSALQSMAEIVWDKSVREA